MAGNSTTSRELSLRISVVIPAYNVVSCIARAIDSVLKQTVLPSEIIVVDDGSSDGLEAFLAGFANKLLKYYRQENSGAAAARNSGVSLASGELVAFLDADDFWHPQKLERQISAFRDIDDLGLCYTDCVTTKDGDHDGITLPQHVDASPMLIDDFCTIFENPYFGTSGVLLRREFFEIMEGFNPHLNKAEDVDFWLRFSYRFKVAYVPAVLWVIVVRPHGLSSSGGVGGFADNIHVIDIFCRDHADFADNNRELVQKTVRSVYMQWGRAALSANQLAEARQGLWAAFKIRPSLEVFYLMLKTIFRTFQS